MRYVLILGLLIAGSASAQAATLYRHDTGQRVFISPKVAQCFDAVPGWAEAPRPSIRYEYVPSYDDPSKFGGGAALPVR
jgi:hypothetical protein